MLLVSMSGLVENNAVKVFHHYSVHLSFSFLVYNLTFIKENNNVIIFQFTFHIFLPLVNL